ncbi:endochitinase-like [Lasioglossum baleicum]|uniref:endochitinase-like n=1 Tax=Lasioglossum baleicum TaxID=434251 RepID=UPI003FCD38C9
MQLLKPSNRRPTMMHTKIAVLAIFLAIAALSTAEKKIICYYESWAKDNPGEGKYPITSLDVNLCTHVIYSFVGVKSNGEFKLLDDKSDLPHFTKYVKGHGAKALLSVGGASEKSKKFSNIAANAESRHRFVESAVNYLKKYNFDGLDVDWEYPNQNGGKKADKKNFVELLKELKQAFSSHGYSLSAAVGAEQDSASRSYKISKIAAYLDFINVMTYDFNGYYNGYTGMNSPLYASAKDEHDDYYRQLNINASIHYWLDQGAPANKLIVGIPFYGITFTLKDSSQHGLHAPASGPGKKGPFTNDEGNIGYNEMCVNLKKSGWTVVRTGKEDVPYAYKGKQWVSYDDPSSVRLKAEYAKSHNLGGVMIWSVDTDDFHGNCGPKNALLNAIHGVLKK